MLTHGIHKDKSIMARVIAWATDAKPAEASPTGAFGVTADDAFSRASDAEASAQRLRGAWDQKGCGKEGLLHFLLGEAVYWRRIGNQMKLGRSVPSEYLVSLREWKNQRAYDRALHIVSE